MKVSSVLLAIGVAVLLIGVGTSVAGLRPLAVIDASVGPVNVRAEGITDDQATILTAGIILLAVGAILRGKTSEPKITLYLHSDFHLTLQKIYQLLET